MTGDLRAVLDEDDIEPGLRLESLGGQYHCEVIRVDRGRPHRGGWPWARYDAGPGHLEAFWVSWDHDPGEVPMDGGCVAFLVREADRPPGAGETAP